MQIASNRLKLTNYDGPETYIDCISNGAVELYHNAGKKFETGATYSYVYGVASGNPAGLVVRNTNTAGDYDHASLRLESRNNAVYGTVYADKANASLRLGYETTGNTFHVFGDGTVRGAGIKFGSDTAAANTLDDYEEGTWTPAWAAGGGSSGLANIANCEYVKIGELVHLRGEFSLTGGSGNVSTVDGWYITGLPFPNTDSSGTAGSWWMSSSWTSGTRASGIVMAYSTNILYFGTEYASGMGRLTNIRHFACTYRTN